ncbi:hypothetical protein P5V78_12885 [Mycobacteroides abscessus subsp. abscessus]|uniref:hypothetical protein n=1 Tax=Mycobacteroides abscessus TaxID=36809 RepID=UPI00092AEEBC|nr:hypothetical protein [Mycobacteroides abscessus]MBN7402848.1 hypothetical protein [Mycobacteroides abscessus subsp. abscessus]MDO3088885.1 hypothetical protein [Mycobacteroides abscessus subsp. abscessus]MDO3270650.1 hypothetical protein [Mycobacteroides abscessus subsp. abscessus]SHQ37476.1 Uncharacterised protein [Mycobacteroides abscessus subsp. abscessus]SHY83487.1 Uncharacterised protein [Mycobacteroides abscessus subsp. abscessus]
MTTAETRREALAAQLLDQPHPTNILGILEQRDAIDRVAQIEDDDTASRLIALAVSVDDEVMVRALLHGAYRYRWRHTIDAFAELRPEQATAATELWNAEKEQHGR